MGILYRAHQFWRTITANIDPHDQQRALEWLNPEQVALFLQLQASEKNHALQMAGKLIEKGEHQPDLLAAALLHDVGKLRYRMNPLERAMVVLVKAFRPEAAHRWGRIPQSGWETAPGWRKPFVLAEQHAAWGAELAREAGVSNLTVTLIRCHEHRHTGELTAIENDLLNTLWVVDNES